MKKPRTKPFQFLVCSVQPYLIRCL